MDQLTDEELEITYRVYLENELPGPMLSLVWMEIYRRAQANRAVQRDDGEGFALFVEDVIGRRRRDLDLLW